LRQQRAAGASRPRTARERGTCRPGHRWLRQRTATSPAAARQREGGRRAATLNRRPPKTRLGCVARLHAIRSTARASSRCTSARKRAKPRSCGPRLPQPRLGRHHLRCTPTRAGGRVAGASSQRCCTSPDYLNATIDHFHRPRDEVHVIARRFNSIVDHFQLPSEREPSDRASDKSDRRSLSLSFRRDSSHRRSHQSVLASHSRVHR